MNEAERIEIAAACPDLAYFADRSGGEIITDAEGRRRQRTHFGADILAGGYYGDWMSDLIARLGGVHEPQEEKVFDQALAAMPDGARMLELGGYWAYYTIWFLRAVNGGEAAMIEPIDHRREIGVQNLALNGLSAPVLRAAVGAESSANAAFATGAETSDGLRIVTVDELLQDFNWPTLDILHADIQGYEKRMLDGAGESLKAQKISWVFLSTHRGLEDARRMDLHQHAIDTLRDYGYHLVCAHTPEESFSTDGLVVAKTPGAPGPDSVDISYRKTGDRS
ncbi:MAG: FkbM family methyltransferase [Pseudomonadota bacterium]